MSHACFSVAGLPFSVEADSPVSILLPPEYEPFSTSQPPAGTEEAARYHVAPARDGVTRPSGATVFWENDLWRTGRTPAGETFFEIYDVQIDGWRLAGTAVPTFESGTLYPRPNPAQPTSVLPLHHPHDRALILGRLANRQGGVVHASAVAVDGKGLLFVGRSGAGKTTMARLWRQAGATILNDERNIVRLAGETAVVGSTPWHGEENQVNPVTVPLAGVFYLAKSQENRVSPVSCETSVARLFTGTFVPVFIEEGPARVLDAWADVLERVPSFDLAFAPDERVVPFCLAAVTGG